MMVKIAVAEPIPTANATTASSATAGAVFQELQAWEKADSTAGDYTPFARREDNGVCGSPCPEVRA